jgi:DNA-binding NarL/FixJ family response regulator
VRIALVDDHPVFRTGLRAFLESQGDLEVVAELDTARAAVLASAELPVDLFVVDIKLPDRDGVALVDELSRAGRRCLMLTMYDDADYAGRAMEAGAIGYALKSDPPERLVEAVRAVARDEMWLAPSLAVRLRGEPQGRVGLASLSRREREVFDLVVRGLSGREIAKRLFISPKTVESHRYRINHKLGVRSVAELVRFAALRRLPID